MLPLGSPEPVFIERYYRRQRSLGIVVSAIGEPGDQRAFKRVRIRPFVNRGFIRRIHPLPFGEAAPIIRGQPNRSEVAGRRGRAEPGVIGGQHRVQLAVAPFLTDHHVVAQ